MFHLNPSLRYGDVSQQTEINLKYHPPCTMEVKFPDISFILQSFRRLLLNKCQDEFENRSNATAAFDKKDGPLTEEESEQYHVAKEKMLGNIKFIGKFVFLISQS